MNEKINLTAFAGIHTQGKCVTLFCDSKVGLPPTRMSYETILSILFKYDFGLYFIEGTRISNFQNQFIIAFVYEFEKENYCGVEKSGHLTRFIS